MNKRRLTLDEDGVISEPQCEDRVLCGIVHELSGRLILHLAGEEDAFRLIVPGIRQVYTMSDPELGGVLSLRSPIFEIRYVPVTEETIFAVREAYEERKAWNDSMAREIRACAYALEWWSSYGTDGVAVGSADPADLSAVS